MKDFFKENRNNLLLLLLASLIFLLWGRAIFREICETAATQELSTVQARVRCAASFGWDADPGSETVDKVRIPEQFDSVYEEYNKLQTMCGFDLRRYRGKTLDRCTYLVRNFPGGGDVPVYIHLYLYEDALVAGDCMTTALDGFMLPLDRRFAP